MFFDRILDEKMQLPYNKKEMTFQPNDFLYRSTLKSILQKLQANNDYIYKCSTISDTLIPSVDDCSVLATTNNSYYVFVDADGNEHKEVPILENVTLNKTLESIKKGYVLNPNFDIALLKDATDVNQFVYPLKQGDKPRTTYASKWQMIPNVKYVLDLEYGKLKRYNLSAQTNTKTALDPTFYQQILEDGTIIEPKFPFDELVAIDGVITDVGMQKIVITPTEVKEYIEGQNITPEMEVRSVKRIRVLIALAFETKILILRYIYYPEDFYVNAWLGDDLNFNDNSRDYIELSVIDPSNKNSLEFLKLRDIRINGNYMYVVDEKLNMVIRYNIEFIRTA